MLTGVSLLHLYKKFLHFCDINILAKCGVGNQELAEILKWEESFKRCDIKNKVYKNLGSPSQLQKNITAISKETCFDLGAQESVQFDQFPCLQVKLVLGHVNFPEKIAEWRLCCFLFQEKVINLLKNCRSPVLVEVINSCNIKVSFSAIHFLVFGLAFNCSFILCST